MAPTSRRRTRLGDAAATATPRLAAVHHLSAVVPDAPPRYTLDRTALDRALVAGDPAFSAQRTVWVLAPWMSLIDIAPPRQVFEVAESVSELVLDDLRAHAARDPAAARGGGWEYLCLAVGSWLAVAVYRVAHAMLAAFDGQPRVALVARQMSEAARLATAVEIHPAATVGPRLVIDHGEGTVIGVQARLGADVVVLHRVTIGSRFAADGPVAGRRHPTVGDNVVFSYDSAALGSIEIGSDVQVGPGCRITRPVPPGSQVRVFAGNQRILLAGESEWTDFT